MNKHRLRLLTSSKIKPLRYWSAVRGQSLAHYFVYYDSKGRAFALCGWRAQVSDLDNQPEIESCLKCELTYAVLGKRD